MLLRINSRFFSEGRVKPGCIGFFKRRDRLVILHNPEGEPVGIVNTKGYLCGISREGDRRIYSHFEMVGVGEVSPEEEESVAVALAEGVDLKGYIFKDRSVG